MTSPIGVANSTGMPPDQKVNKAEKPMGFFGLSGIWTEAQNKESQN
jgi:hypothetical protein